MRIHHTCMGEVFCKSLTKHHTRPHMRIMTIAYLLSRQLYLVVAVDIAKLLITASHARKMDNTDHSSVQSPVFHCLSVCTVKTRSRALGLPFL